MNLHLPILITTVLVSVYVSEGRAQPATPKEALDAARAVVEKKIAAEVELNDGSSVQLKFNSPRLPEPDPEPPASGILVVERDQDGNVLAPKYLGPFNIVVGKNATAVVDKHELQGVPLIKKAIPLCCEAARSGGARTLFTLYISEEPDEKMFLEIVTALHKEGLKGIYVNYSSKREGKESPSDKPSDATGGKPAS